MTTDWKLLSYWAEKLGVKLSLRQIEKFQSYCQLLLEYNQRFNLISRQDTNRIVSYHFIDSITATEEISQTSIVCDLGSGAGLPGIPIKIIRDDINLCLVESIKKKAYFLNEVIKILELKNTFVLNVRAETIQDIKFDIILVRLLGKIVDILPIASKLVSSNGKIIFYKIEGAGKEIAQANKIANKYNLELQAIKDIKLPVTDILRKLVIYRHGHCGP